MALPALSAAAQKLEEVHETDVRGVVVSIDTGAVQLVGP
jgi:hypothetical protein